MQDAAQRIDDRAFEPGYPAHVLERPEATAGELAYQENGHAVELPWTEVLWAIAAEIGEPEGVRTIVFDLLVLDPEVGFRVLRMDADPGVDAMDLARTLVQALGTDRKLASLRCLAMDGIPARWYPDLGSFELDAVIELRAFGPASLE